MATGKKSKSSSRSYVERAAKFISREIGSLTPSGWAANALARSVPRALGQTPRKKKRSSSSRSTKR